MIAIVGGTIIPVTKKIIRDGVVLVKGNKIASVGKSIKIPDKAAVLSAKGHFVLPGLIDAHTHLGIHEVGIREEGWDYNEITEPVSAQLRAIDAINPLERGFQYARCGGVTTVGVAPGSATPIGGTVVAIKTAGSVIDDMVIKNPVGVKAALGENPKRVGREFKRAPFTRMSTAAYVRSMLVKAQNYLNDLQWAKSKKKKVPDRDLAIESFIPVLKKEIPLRVHAHRADDIATAIRIAEEFDIKIVIEHGTEAHKIAEWLAHKNIPVVAGPTIGTPTKVETQARSFKTLRMLKQAGILFSITTDHPFNAIHYLLLGAMLAVKEGLDEQSALQAITINPARILGLDDRVGSLEPGRDADIVIFSGDPFDARSRVLKTLINGEIVFDAETDETPF
jgi:imidazolonepropionase-like amidohydrolase